MGKGGRKPMKPVEISLPEPRTKASSPPAVPRVLFLLSGPIHEISATLRLTMERLSEAFEGTIVTTMPNPIQARIGRFRLLCLNTRARHRFFLYFKYMCYALGLAIHGRVTGKKWDLVATYDPMRTGMMGLLTARLAGARFTPEVNGVYDSYANYLDIRQDIFTRIRKWLYPHWVHFVLRQADGIKILFPKQLARFLAPGSRQVVSSFFAYVDLSPFRDLGEKKEVLFVGFPFWLKGVDILIAAFKRVATRHPDWKLKIMGWYPDMTELDKHMGGHPQIFHHPPVLHSRMHMHIGSCGIFVLPSRTEAMGRVLLEAMAASKPRIGSDVDGIPTVIDDWVDGLLFRCGNVDDLAAKLDLLMGDPKLRKSLGSRGRERAEREFTSDAYFSKLIGFYRRVLCQ